MDVPVRELKSNLSALLRHVQEGHEVTVTAHRKPVAKLVPIAKAPPAGNFADRLLAAGLISHRPEQRRFVRRPPNPLPPGVGLVSDAVIEDRG